jgi:sugar O-acyltransferase (sialic acid O-acetyltransferase NeuD family)
VQRIVIFGGGGHAMVLLDALASIGRFTVVGFVVPEEMSGTLADLPVHSEASFATGAVACDGVVLGIGDNVLRDRVVQKIRATGRPVSFPTVVSPRAMISPSVVVGEGSVILHHAVVNSRSRIGNFCVVNTAAVVEHDCVLGDFAALGPRAVIGGSCRVDAFSLVGIGACVLPSVHVGRNTVLGGGATVVRDVEDDCVQVGVPAVRVRSRAVGERMLG